MVLRILVAVGDRAVADLAASALADDGHDVLRADAGTPALDAVRRAGYDLLVATDPAARIDDVLLIRFLRDHPGLARPIILLAPARPFPLPPNSTFLPLPLDVDDLSALVADLLAKARAGDW